MDEKTGGANQSFLLVDTSTNEICVAGQVQEVDDTSSLDSTVTFTYESIGNIDKATDKKVRGNFGSVLLTLEIEGGSSPFPPQTITASCNIIKASLLKEGERDKVSLRCELGENYAAFTGLTSAQIQSIDNAFTKVKRVKARSKNGVLRITNQGVPTAPGGPTCVFSAS